MHHGARPGRDQIFIEMTDIKESVTDKRAINVLTSNNESFGIEDMDGNEVTLCLFPLQLGRLAMITRRLLDLDILLDNNAEDPVKQMWKVCAERAREVAEIIAIATLRTRKEIDEQFEARTQLLLDSPTMTSQACVNLLYAIVFMSYYEDFTDAIRLVRTLRVTISQNTAAKRIATTEGKVSGGK